MTTNISTAMMPGGTLYSVRDFRAALEGALEGVEPDNPVAATGTLERVFSRFEPEAETTRQAAKHAAAEALRPFFEAREMPSEQAVAWTLSDVATRSGPAPLYGEDVEPHRNSDSGELVRLSEVEPERVKWLWPSRIPCGRMTILDGDPGLGKSSLTMDVAARVSMGSAMPDGSGGSRGPAGVVLLSAEDGLANTIRPRLDAARADVDRVAALRYVVERDHEGEPQKRLPTVQDVTELERTLREMDAALLVVDPLVAYLGSGVNAHRDQDVRAGLADLADLAERTGVAVLAVRHLNKSGGGNPLYRGGGSIGLIAAARSGLLVAPDPDDPDSDRRVLASTKCNLAKKPPALAFRVVPENGTLRISWEGESDHDASTLLEREDREDRTAREEAAHVLREELSEGPRPVSELRHVAESLGVTWRTVRRAADSIDVQKERVGGVGADGRWIWSLPADEDPQSGQAVPLEDEGHPEANGGKGSPYPDTGGVPLEDGQGAQRVKGSRAPYPDSVSEKGTEPAVDDLFSDLEGDE